MHKLKKFLAVQREIFMPMLACCTKGKSVYAKSALLYSKGGHYANDCGIKPPRV